MGFCCLSFFFSFVVSVVLVFIFFPGLVGIVCGREKKGMNRSVSFP